MKRYIDAENAKSYIYGQFVDRFPPFTLGAIIEGMDDIETEEVAPVVHAHWIETEDLSGNHYAECSNCCLLWWIDGESSQEAEMNYCPRCGAKMDEEVDDG